MTVQLSAPYPTIETITYLPNPELSDVKSGRNSLNITRAMDGTTRSYVKSNTRKSFSYTFRLTRMKAFELEEFIDSYYGSKIKLKDHDSNVWIVDLTNNPFDFSTAGRSNPGADTNADESVTVILNFEGKAA